MSYFPLLSAPGFRHIKKTQNDSATADVALGQALDSNSISFVLKPNCKTVSVKKHGKTVRVKACK